MTIAKTYQRYNTDPMVHFADHPIETASAELARWGDLWEHDPWQVEDLRALSPGVRLPMSGLLIRLRLLPFSG